MKILITGDFVIKENYATDYISQEVINLFQNSDFNIVNLEAPVTSASSQIVKTGPHLKAHKESTLSVLKALKIDGVTLANNHVLDYDQQGVMDTLAFCHENSIATVGAGKNKDEASKTFCLNTTEGKIVFINIAENEWASATENTAGANGMDLIDDVKQIQEAKLKSDFVFVIVHGGHEYYNLPSPRMQKQYRFYLDNGADIVIGHHTHCISGSEVYKGKEIYYSLGNFLFTKPSDYSDWFTGLILEVDIKDGKLDTKLHPVRQQNKTFSLDLLKTEEKEKIFSRISSFNSIIREEQYLKEQWNGFIATKTNSYLNYWSPLSYRGSGYLKVILNKIGIRGLNRKGMKMTLNLLRCEAHLDASKEVIKKYLTP